ncbi:permease-like cell division protein FtsX [Aminipila sp.]|jgi:cell division transport system permease protein|uniref:permease-like cell division protein FtsX n=1 Tax=Aminipila sp. TaxID=2060095 RepID=UPI001D2C4E2D|nr:permease-like cell division protein FtsX [Aminipila sp.]MBE6034208.1 ABC transporter permease [Clostridiales bacterium]
MFNSIKYTLKQAFIQVFRNRTMSLASIFSITAMLLILGLFFVLIVNINMAAESAKQEYDTVQVYLLDATTYEQAQNMITEVKGLRGVADATYLSKEDALADWKTDWGERAYLLDSLSSNPLPNSIIVKVETLETSDTVVEALRQQDGIEDVKYYKETVEKLIKITDAIQIAAFIIMIFLVIVSVVVVSNTIKLTVLARSREIRIMKYVGATNWFIRGPFLLEGIIIGMISAGISALIVAFVYGKTVELIGRDLFLILSTPMVAQSFLTAHLIYIFLAIGVSIGACGSIVSMRRFLDT